jgi:hypothetical protein
MLALISTTLAASKRSEATAVSEAFEKARAASDLAGVIALYEEEATAIWPEQSISHRYQWRPSGVRAHKPIDEPRLASQLRRYPSRSGSNVWKLREQHQRPQHQRSVIQTARYGSHPASAKTATKIVPRPTMMWLRSKAAGCSLSVLSSFQGKVRIERASEEGSIFRQPVAAGKTRNPSPPSRP